MPAGAGPVLDHHILLQPDRQLFRHDAHADVGDAAGTVRHDELDRSVGIIGLGAGRRGECPCRKNHAPKCAASDHRKSPPRPCYGWAHCFTALVTVKHGLPRCRTSVNRLMNCAMRTRYADGPDMILVRRDNSDGCSRHRCCGSAAVARAGHAGERQASGGRHGQPTQRDRSLSPRPPRLRRREPPPIGNRWSTSGADETPSAATTKPSCSTITC